LVQARLRRHTQAMIVQISPNTVCDRRHSLEQQTCRWLLLALDRALERSVLAKRSCDCYAAVRAEVDRTLLGHATQSLQERRQSLTTRRRARLSRAGAPGPNITVGSAASSQRRHRRTT
jgi:hypothetical protein